MHSLQRNGICCMGYMYIQQNMIDEQLPLTASQVDSDVLHPMFLFQLYAPLCAYADDKFEYSMYVHVHQSVRSRVSLRRS